MLFVCEVEKQGNIIHVGVSVPGNFLHLEGQAPLRSSGIDAARICGCSNESDEVQKYALGGIFRPAS